MALIYKFTDEDIKNFIVDSPEKSYTLGFLWGDGCLKRFKNKQGYSNIVYPGYEIVKEDFDNIQNLFNYWNIEWKIHFRNRKGRKPQGNAYTFNRNFGYFLSKYDYLNKSNCCPTSILSIIPEKLKKYWWRGFLDADGCFYVKNKASQLSFSGSYGLSWKELQLLFTSLGIEKYQIQQRIHKNSKSSSIRISSKESICKFGNYIYQDNLHIGLKRKFLKFLEIKNNCLLQTSI